MDAEEKKRQRDEAKIKILLVRFLILAVFVGLIVFLINLVKKSASDFSYSNSSGAQMKMFKDK